MQFAFVPNALPVRISRGRAARRVPRATSSSVSPQSRPEAATMELTVGQAVRVSTSVTMYHYPKHRNEPYDVQGLEGVIAKNVGFQDGVEMSATKPYTVKFEKPKFTAHFSEDELEVL